MLPNFLVCGAAKCGTTALWVWLDEHPEILMASLKEPRYFTRDGCKADLYHPSGANAPGQFDKGLEWYQSLYNNEALIRDSYKPEYGGDSEGAGGRASVGESLGIRAVGEATTLYFTAEDSPRLINEIVADAKIVILLRNPVERVLSHYWHDRRYGWNLPEFSKMIRKDGPVRNHYFLHSYFRANLSRYLEVFDQSNIRVYIYEEFFKNPSAALPDLYEFIGVDEKFMPPSINARYNVASTARFSYLQRMMMGRYAAKLAKMVPSRMKSPLANLRQHLVRLNSKPSPYSDLAESDRWFLNDYFAGEIRFIEEFLGRPVESWHPADGN